MNIKLYAVMKAETLIAIFMCKSTAECFIDDTANSYDWYIKEIKGEINE